LTHARNDDLVFLSLSNRLGGLGSLVASVTVTVVAD
jgi:hypothetical protein